MEVSFSEHFKKEFRKRITGNTILERAFKQAFELFVANPYDPKLKAHKLSGKLKGLWSFSVDYDIRVIFYFNNDFPPKAVFINIGGHDDVY